MKTFQIVGALAAVLSFGCAKYNPVEVSIGVNGSNDSGGQRSTFAMATTDFSFTAQCNGVAPVDGVGGRVELPVNATGCTIRLTAFRWNGVTMTPSVNFTAYTPGSKATFTGGGMTAFARVDVQLPSPLVAGADARASYTVYGIDGGDDVTVGEGTNASGGVTGDRPPQLKLVAATLDRAASQLTLAWDCTENLVGTTLATASCAGDALATMRFGGDVDAGGTPSEATLAAIIASGASLSAWGATVLPVSTAIPHGGAQLTVTLGSIPSALILALQAQGSSSFRWARVHFSSGSGAGTTQVHVVGAYTDIAGGGSIPVVVDTGVPTILAVTAYDAETWNVQLLHGSTLVKVLRAGYNTQSFTGVPAGVPIETYTGYGYSQATLANWATSIQSSNPGSVVGSAQGAYESGGFLVRSNDGAAVGSMAETHAIGVYEPSNGSSISVTVNRPGKNVTLVLNAYQRTQWSINVIGTTRIARIVGNGYQGSTFTGASVGAVLSGYMSGYSSAYQPGSPAMNAFLSAIVPSLQVSFIGAPTTFTSVQGAYGASSFTIQ